MKKWMQALLVGLVLVAGAVSVQASTVTWTFSGMERGATWSYNGGKKSASEFNITFSQIFEGVSTTFGYCVDLAQTISVGKTYNNYESQEISGTNFLSAAWLIDTYNQDGSADATTISALQAAIWDVTDQDKYNPITSTNLGRKAVYEKYSAMISELKNVASFSGLGLENRYQLLTSSTNQDIIVRTKSPSPVPVPAAVWMLGTGLAGLMGMRWRQRA